MLDFIHMGTLSVTYGEWLNPTEK